jgi:hypothetical protein
MVRIDRGCIIGLGLLALAAARPAAGQENLDLGKSAAQLYASDCAICHKSPNGLTKGGGVFGLSGYLREHYTASRESAAAIAAYLESIDKGPPTAPKRPPTKRTAKGDDKGKPGKPGDANVVVTKPALTKPAEPKPAEAKGGDIKSGEPTSGEPKAGGSKPSDTEPDQAKTAEPKPPGPKGEKSDEKKPD